MRRALLLLCAIGTILSAAEGDAAYTSWSQGRPAEALPELHQLAVEQDSWHRWFDLGLAAAAADQTGKAAVWLVEAHRRAPGASEPVAALRVLGHSIPPSWTSRLGPLAWLGNGWAVPVILALAGITLGLAVSQPRARRRLLITSVILLAVTLPGWIAQHIDATRDLVAITEPGHLMDSTGAPLADGALSKGTVLQREPRDEWNGRLLVRTFDGRRGWVPSRLTSAQP